jgi:spore coat protein H
MNRIIYILIIISLIAGASGCSKETLSGSSSGSNPAPTLSGYSSASNPPEAPTSVIAQPEDLAVVDKESTYAVEVQSVIHANITTYDGVYTFAQVNSDTDPDDAFVPEVDAHFTADNYPDDGLITNSKVRLRGTSTRLAHQKSYRVKLTKGLSLWRRETTLQLNKHPYDLTRVRNKLAFDLFREIPHLPSLRTQFMQVTVNGQDFGLFTHVEKMGKEYLDNRGLPTNGNIYKANDFTFRMVDALALDATGTPLDTAAFERVLELENDNGNHANLIEMLNAVNDATKPLADTFQTYFDRNNYIVWLATNILVGNYDTVSQNFALYQPKDSTKFYFLPWDYDAAFGFENQPDVLAKNNLYSPDQLGIGNWWDVPLHHRFIQDIRNRNDLKLAVKEIYNTYLTGTKIQEKLDEYKALVEPLISHAPDLDYLPTVFSSDKENEWAAEYARLVTTIDTNYYRFLASLERPLPYWQDALVEGDLLVLKWGEAVDLQNDPVTYDIQVATDPLFVNPVFSKTEYVGLNISIPRPPAGKYFMRVTARDSAGNLSGAFDRFDIDQGTPAYFGVKQFEVPK